MAEIQLSFFDISSFDAEATCDYRRKQRRAEVDAWLVELLGPEEARKRRAQQARRRAKLDAILSKPLRPDLQASMDKLRAEMLASAKPFLKEERALLGVEQDATKRDIKNAYRRKARKLHPDVGGDAEAFKQLYAAYRAVLKVTQD
jgi:hypothetical protein